jgi:three-Cys-motif partner protein
MSSLRQEEFFDELKEWSNRKIELVQKYLVGFVRILQSRDNLIYYVDGFAGRGIYDDGSEGSPIRAAKYAKALKDEKKKYSLQCINVDENPKSFSNLDDSTKEFSDVVTNFQGTFLNNIDTILKIINDHPTIFFLDDFGICGTNWDAVKTIINRTAPSDIWIRLDTTTIRRLDGFFDSETPGAKKKFNRLPQLYGIDDKDYLHSRLSGRTPDERISSAKNLYLEQLSSNFRNYKGGKGGYAAAYSIKSIDEQRKYFLAFATGHPRGAILANEIIFNVEESYQTEIQDYKKKQTAQMDFLHITDPTEEEIFESKVEQIRNDIINSCEGKTISRNDIYLLILHKWFGRMAGKHLTRALNDLIESGYILNNTGAVSRAYTKFTFKG